MEYRKMLLGKIVRFLGVSIFLLGLTLVPGVISKVDATSSLEVWWPTNNATVTGVQPFKGMLQGLAVENYNMFWQVDGGQLNWMYTSYTGYPHKEAIVDLSGWKWRGNGPYTVSFVAQDMSGKTLATNSVTIYTGAVSTTTSTTSSSGGTTSSGGTSVSATSGNPFANAKGYIDPYSNAKLTANAWRISRPADAAMMDKIANNPAAAWFGGWNTDITSSVNTYVSKVITAGALPVMVAYNIPDRDCGGYSAGGAQTADAYRSWIDGYGRGLNGRKSVVVLEPDGLANIDCLSSSQKSERFALLTYAVDSLKSKGAYVYLDAGNAHWINSTDMAGRLKSANISNAAGFALNVSNFMTTTDSVNYGTSVSGLVGGKHFIIDTSRNGNGPTSDYQWCNPSGRALGNVPSANTGNGLVDAFWWIKQPGESDGNCNGGPNAGVWWPDYALGLAQRAAW